ncbi:hypothetical protein LGN24_28620 [Burkholderia seminalis]|uniref:hypothetical protein n=1 Tax=Burkholderia seminalis TaxID=488731 RepID=UPI001CF1FBA9|nr:hypothetical protein [Burkholderia seminalis]MCA8305456.1 hypothetical protein [Burkholderia seminalis]
MEFLTSSDVNQVITFLSQGHTLNTSVRTFFRELGSEFGNAEFATKGVSAVVTHDEDAITITTPHGKIVGAAEQNRDDRTLAATATFSVVRTAADGKKSATEIMSVTLTGYGFVTALNGTRLHRSVKFDDEIAYQTALLLLSSIQNNLQSTPPDQGV